MSYREYFEIDPEWESIVNKDLIDASPDLWKKFYPHPSFIKLLKATVDVLKRRHRLSLWVDGAYGTGKSHAVLTLKKLLEASDEETKEYFSKYKLDDFLFKELTKEKNAGKILICHRYGSSDIYDDGDLIVALQEGIEKALADNGIENKAGVSLKGALIRYFENEENKRSFDIYATGTYRDILGGDRANDILDKLNTYKENALCSLIKKILKVRPVKGNFPMTPGELCNWIREVIEKNGLYNLIFIWDEFSEYFENNINRLTGFQKIVELSSTVPFCLMIVTHKAEAYFSDNDPDKKKLLDRFEDPIHILLPVEIAFKLMAQAMKVTDDEQLAAKWAKNKNALDERTLKSRNVVKREIGLTDEALSDVLPIHPYAALLLQHISIFHTSTARSMFNFIKNDEGDDIKAFQWFIENYDFSSKNPFVTIDMLWNFFYETGSAKLAKGIKEILASYTPIESRLSQQERRVLKTILLLQSVSAQMGDGNHIFLPNDENLTLAFEGTDIDMQVKNIARKLLSNHVITRTPLTGDEFSYCCKNTGANIDSGPFKEEARDKSTREMLFMNGSNLRNIIELTGALNLRFSMTTVTLSDFDNEIKRATNPTEDNNKIHALFTIAQGSAEAAALQKKITNFYLQHETDAVVIDASNCNLDEDKHNEFIDNYAMASAIGQSDFVLRKTYEEYATDVLRTWAKRIRSGEFYVYSRFTKNGERVANLDDLKLKLLEIDRLHYPECLEVAYPNVLNTMYDVNSLLLGASCGISEETKGTFRSGSEATKLEGALRDAWKKPEYWKTSSSYIASLKKMVDSLIDKEYEKSDRIAISRIYDSLKAKPYGFMPCNFTAFILGFVLKEYANGVYSYSDNLTTFPLDAEKLASMISGIIKQHNAPDRRYKDKYIVTLTDKERAFNEATSKAFRIDEQYCVSITETRMRIREQMKGLKFPIWVIEFDIDSYNLRTNKNIILTLIKDYCGIANNKNLEGEKSDSDIALDIGELCLNNPEAVEDLKELLTADNCKHGMLKYLKVHRGGLLPTIANRINDAGQYINILASKFNSDAANWVWNQDTVNAKIDELITEYEIVDTSNKILAKQTSYEDTINAWCDKISQIRLAYLVIKNELGENNPFFDMLFNLKKAGVLSDSQKKSFLELLKKNVEDFKYFMANQNELFMNACSFYLDNLTSEDVQNMLDNDNYGFRNSYTNESNIYFEKVQRAVSAYMSGLEHVELQKKWRDLTGTESPSDWSKKYDMPISIMVPNDQIILARRVFSTINMKSADSDAISEAKEYIMKMSYLTELNNKSSRDKAFSEIILGEYAVLFDDLDEVKQYLKGHVLDEPYNWYENKEVFEKIKVIAKDKYCKVGFVRVKKIINEMPAEQLKEYLMQLIVDNIAVGIEIMKKEK